MQAQNDWNKQQATCSALLSGIFRVSIRDGCDAVRPAGPAHCSLRGCIWCAGSLIPKPRTGPWCCYMQPVFCRALHRRRTSGLAALCALVAATERSMMDVAAGRPILGHGFRFAGCLQCDNSDWLVSGDGRDFSSARSVRVDMWHAHYHGRLPGQDKRVHRGIDNLHRT